MNQARHLEQQAERHRPREKDLVKCSDCGRKFNLATQNYYRKKCPACVEK